MYDYSRVGGLVVAALLAWELGQLVATYVIVGVLGDHFSLVLLPANGWDQADTVAVLLLRLALAAAVAVPPVLLAARLLFGARDRR